MNEHHHLMVPAACVGLWLCVNKTNRPYPRAEPGWFDDSTRLQVNKSYDYTTQRLHGDGMRILKYTSGKVGNCWRGKFSYLYRPVWSVNTFFPAQFTHYRRGVQIETCAELKPNGIGILGACANWHISRARARARSHMRNAFAVHTLRANRNRSGIGC